MMELDEKQIEKLKNGECIEQNIDGEKLLVCGLPYDEKKDI